jgi:hypothetical protein
MIQTGRRTTFNLHRLSEGKKHEQKFCPTQIFDIYIYMYVRKMRIYSVEKHPYRVIQQVIYIRCHQPTKNVVYNFSINKTYPLYLYLDKVWRSPANS